MKRIATVALGVLLAALPAAAAQGTKTARGTVTTTAPDALTVKVDDRDMTFKVDSTTKVMAHGAGTATRAAKAEGKEGPAFTSLVKPGQSVEVSYHENGMHAGTIRVVSSPPGSAAGTGTKSAMSKPTGSTEAPAGQTAAGTTGKSGNATGVVTAVGGSSLTVKTAAGEQTFTIEERTKVVGAKMGRKADAMKKAGERTIITEFVETGDTVRVNFTDDAGTKKASEVHVTRKKLM